MITISQQNIIISKNTFKHHPNVFDKFVSCHLIEAQNITKEKERELHILNNKYQDQFYEIKRLTQYIGEQQATERSPSSTII